MFYERSLSQALRFGDVLRGFFLTSSHVKEVRLYSDFAVNVELPAFSIVLSPCCSISDRMIVLSPLVQVRGAFFKNPYFSEDLTRINRRMEPEQTVPPSTWAAFAPEEKARRLSEESAYAFGELFVYEGHSAFPAYEIPRKEGSIKTNYYMIDFRNSHKVNCNRIVSAKDSPVENKVLELTIQTRTELRQKISDYYARIPQEDKNFEL